jgi:hypothetical protein
MKDEMSVMVAGEKYMFTLLKPAELVRTVVGDE